MRSSSEVRQTTQAVARHELIGFVVHVDSPHKGWDGMTGRVVDETKNVFVIDRSSDRREVMVPKGGQRFRFRSAGQEVVVMGDEIRHRPEQRTKKIKG